MRNIESAMPLRFLMGLLVGLTVVLGCAPAQPPPLPQSVRGLLSPLRLAAFGTPTGVTIIPIPTGRAKGAAHGAGQAVAGAVQGCLDVDPTGICAVMALFISPYLAAGGAVYGLAAVEEESEVSAAKMAIMDALAQCSKFPRLELKTAFFLGTFWRSDAFPHVGQALFPLFL